MDKYLVKVGAAGYCRGTQVFEVDAESIDDAMETWWAGELIEDKITRDDREHEVWSVKKKEGDENEQD
jgi:hypothetical protein